MKKLYLITVVITSYNLEKFIRQTLESVFYQTFKNYEVIIVDDSSKDSSVEIIKEYINGKDNWQLIVNEENLGVIESRNIGINNSNGDYIAFLDGDDVWENNKLQTQCEIIKSKNLDFCFTSYSIIDEFSREIGYTYKTNEKATYSSLLKENYIGCSSVVFRKELWSKIIIDSNIEHEDFFVWLQFVKQGCSNRGIIESLVKYRIHTEGRSYNKINAAKNRFKIYTKYEGLGIFYSMYLFLVYTKNAIKKYFKMYINTRKLK